MLPTYLTFSENPSLTLTQTLEEMKADKVAILVDENTKKHCLPGLESYGHVIEIKSGETEKTLATCEHIWSEMTQFGMTRSSLLINLGGGVIGDMGGFAASTFKRGMRFINIPTTLLSMVDASIGGKLGIDFHGLKNHIGVFKDPDQVIIAPVFLNTLEKRQIRSGFAEMIKHALIADAEYWSEIKQVDLNNVDWQPLIRRSVELKADVVLDDPFESGRRKILNFGHTLGHAIESHFLETENPLLHGEAIAVGMILESQLSVDLGMLSKGDLDEIMSVIERLYESIDLPPYDQLSTIVKQDKKNQGENLSFSLISKIGHSNWDVPAARTQLENVIRSYNQIKQTN